MNNPTRHLAFLLGTLALGGFAWAAVLVPTSRINPQTGDIEIADPVWTGTNYDIDYVIDPGDGGAQDVFTLTEHPADDLHPGIAMAANGDAWVVWWRDGASDEVWARKRSLSTGSWSAERLVSQAGENSRNPRTVHHDDRAWVAYECKKGGGGTSVAVNTIDEEPDPIGTRSVLRTTWYTGDLDLRIHSEAGHLWVTWIDTGLLVGWAEYDATADSWSYPTFESYAADDTDSARARVRADVLAAF